MAGLNLLELLIVMLIIAILAGIGVPSFRYVTASNRISSEVNALLGDMRYARTEAIKEGSWVTVCAATINLASSTASCSGAGGAGAWNTGWIVFSDTSNDQTAPSFANLLRVQTQFVGGDTFKAADATSTPVVAVTFNREGFATSYTTLGSGTTPGTAANGATLVTLNAFPKNSDWTRCLAINNIGMITTETPNASTASASVGGFTPCT
jgi:type IV fimbrial biogenesis protein FimT